jgi:hypothetical protein
MKNKKTGLLFLVFLGICFYFVNCILPANELKPENIEVSQGLTNKITVSCDQVQGAESYIFYRASQSRSLLTTTSSSSSTTSSSSSSSIASSFVFKEIATESQPVYTDTDVDTSNFYFYRIKAAYKYALASEYSDVASGYATTSSTP